MRNHYKSGELSEKQHKEEVLGLLFQHASARQKAPSDDELSIREATMQEWRKVVKQRRRKKYLFAFGMAASLVLTISVVVRLSGESQDMVDFQQIAVVENFSGDIFIRADSEKESASSRLVGNELGGGQVLRTAGGAGLAMNWVTGESIRIDENSELGLLSENEILLTAGRIYIDTRNVISSQNDFVIKTRAGTVRHLGTQYMAGISAHGLSVTVREGKVLVNTPSSETAAIRGEKLSIDISGDTTTTMIPTYGPIWEWAELITPEFNLDGVTAFEFINWAGRETGRSVVFETDEIRVLAKETRLRGSINLEPNRALELILQTSDLEARVKGSEILIGSRTGA